MNTKKGIYRCDLDCRYGNLHGIFVATDDEVQEVIGKGVEFGEVCRRRQMESWEGQKPGGPGEIVRNQSWPDGRHSGSTLNISNILSKDDGVSRRVAILRGFGNAIVPQIAAEFIRAAIEAINNTGK